MIQHFQKNKTITKIIQLADIHIKTGDKEKSRFDEYSKVFENLYNDLLKFCDENTIIFILGDITHDKCKIEDSGITLFYLLMEKLSLLAPVYVLQGNHDIKQHSLNNEDILKALMKPLKEKSKRHNKIHYLNTTGHYQIGNLGFGLVSVSDTLAKGNTYGRVEKLPDFPPAEQLNTKTKIALFHGTINSSRLQNFTESFNTQNYPLGWFKDYDIVLLGDVHMQQINNAVKNNLTNQDYKLIKDNSTQPIWAYSSSLIQQNFGDRKSVV